MSSQSIRLLSAISSMKSSVKQGINSALIVVGLLLGATSGVVNAAIIPIDIVYVGVWDSTGSANSVVTGGPGVTAGQKYVITLSYDESSVVTNGVNVTDLGGNPTGNLMSTIDLSAVGNSLNVYVPMAGLDAGAPFIYTQDESDHFFFGTNSLVPTLNFVDNSFIGDKANIIGLEFEGDFFPGSGDNVFQLFNTAPPGGITSMNTRITNIFTGVAASDTDLNVDDSINQLAEAVELMVEAGPDIIYNATSLVQAATAVITQSNELGAGRTDGEDFIDVNWSPSGTVTGNTNEVGIADSGLTTTVSTTTWTANAAEQMTGKVDSDTLGVSFLNTIPTLNASSTVSGTSVDFIFDAGDADLAVNALIAGFEMLSFNALVDGVVDASGFFADLFSVGSFSYSMNDLLAQFGSGLHNVNFSAMDRAGELARVSFDFNVEGNLNPPSISEPNAILLMFASLILLWRKQRKH